MMTLIKISFAVASLLLIASDNHNITTTLLSEGGQEILNGRIKQIESYYEIRISVPATDVTSFDDKGHQIETLTKTASGMFNKSIKYNYMYDSKGKIAEVAAQIGSGRNVYKYNAEEYPVGMFYYDQRDSLQQKFLYKCDGAGNVIQIDRFEDGKHQDFTMKAHYGKNHLLEEFDGFWRSGELAYKTTYKGILFDEKHNWIKEKVTEDEYIGTQTSTRVATLVRKITYY